MAGVFRNLTVRTLAAQNAYITMSVQLNAFEPVFILGGGGEAESAGTAVAGGGEQTGTIDQITDSDN
jgi:hypothetical protein